MPVDSIEKAMFGRSLNPVVSPGATRTLPAKSDPIERSAGIADEPPVGRGASPASYKRTQRSVMLDLEQIRAAKLLVPDTQRSQIKEEYRHVKRPLLMNIDGKGATTSMQANLIAVTSARPGEGKTFTACNLALSIATERNRTVLLVDADVLRPSVTKMLGFEADYGLVDFLLDDQLELADVLINTSIPSLTVLPAGSKHHLSAELLAGENMRRLTAEMSQHYSDRIIIFDSPPLLATTEASILVSLMGQVIIVVEAERTLQSQVKEALAILNPNQLIGFVLNKSRDFFTSNYYGYGYGYQYAHHRDKDSEAR
jgi:receptor protein-tyrosine kinase